MKVSKIKKKQFKTFRVGGKVFTALRRAKQELRYWNRAWKAHRTQPSEGRNLFPSYIEACEEDLRKGSMWSTTDFKL